MNATELRDRLKKWKPPKVPDRKPGGPSARRFPEAVRSIRGGGFRPGYRS